MIATLNRCGLRAAFRECALVLGIPPAEVNRWSKRLPYYYSLPRSDFDGSAQSEHGEDEPDPRPAASSGNPIEQVLRETPEAAGFPFEDPRFQEALARAAQLVDAPRHLGLHPGGVVVAPESITDHVSCHRAAKGVIAAQFDKDAVEAIGLVKMDLLGNRALTTIDDCLKHLAARGIAVDFAALPEDEPETARTLGEGRTLGCFQIESPGMRNLLQQIGARTMDDVIQAVALIRPGPASSGMKDAYVRRFRELEPPTPPHPRLTELLWDTFGVMLYQEDVMQAASLRRRHGPRRGRPPAPRADQAPRARARSAARALPRRCARAGHRARGRRTRLGTDLELRLLRLLQGARGHLRAHLLARGLAQDAPPGRVPGELPRQRHGLLRRARVRRGGAAPGRSDPAARRQPEQLELRARVARRDGCAARRPGAGEGALAEDARGAARNARAARGLRLAAGVPRAHGRAVGRGRGADPLRRLRAARPHDPRAALAPGAAHGPRARAAAPAAGRERPRARPGTARRLPRHAEEAHAERRRCGAREERRLERQGTRTRQARARRGREHLALPRARGARAGAAAPAGSRPAGARDARSSRCSA